ncbi:MAG: tRNA (adenosine(37)-N6)-threonylcarbamoyltransferase complex dimerization subunit type 1 TsaB [candidate division WOR-3 bacterium]|nr:tRNA (adenosine(37)-N6)-threonylcarbamoyltransferase complex dimerization subunit type 1 TsaB [candidate division WOR-3 bacterium]
MAISSVTGQYSVLIERNGEQYFEKAENEDILKWLPLTVEKMIAEHNVEMNNMEAIILSSGPGYYTGTRLGISFAKGIACGSGQQPVIYLDSLEVLADSTDREGLIVPLLKARKNEFHYSVFSRKKGQLKRLSGNSIIKKDRLKHIRAYVLGEGLIYCRQSLENAAVIEKLYCDAYDLRNYYMRHMI